MAHRPLTPRLTLPVPDAGAALDRLGRRVVELPRRLPRGRDLALVLWQIVWLPYWLGSDVPAPHLPARDARPPAQLGLAGIQVARLIGSMARRIWLQWILTILARAAWLVLLVGCMWLLIELAGGPALESAPLIGTGIILFTLGVVFAAITRPTRWRVARMLDRRFRLHERMTTALVNLGQDVPKEGERARIVYLQVADAANVATILRQHPAFRARLPVREIVLATTFGLIFAALSFARGVGGGIPETDAGLVPAFVPAIERLAAEAEERAAQAPTTPGDTPSIQEVQERAQRSHEAQRDLQTLGNALDDHAVTRPAAEEIAAGDYDEAAQSLRDLGEQADRLSPASREALANDLESAAGEMSEGSAALSSAASEAAEGLRSGGEAAQSGVSELGDAVEATGEEVIPREELAGQMERARTATSSSSDDVSQTNAGQQDGQTSSSETAGEPGSEQGGEQSEQGSEQGEPGGSEETSRQPGDPGEGADAEPGEGQAEQREGAAAPGENPGNAEGEGNGQGQSSDSGEASSPGEGGEQAGQASNPTDGQPADDASSQGASGESGDSQSAQGGSGAGSGDGEPSGSQAEGAGSQENPPAEGVPAEQRVNEADPADTTSTQVDGAGDETETISLSGSAGQGIQTGSDSGSASLGNGAGAASGGGSATQGEVGESGPDSNRVPPEYQPVVESYFSDPNAP
ncbi:MAG TPA: hypothetical protein VGR16_09420 [Thermomicrobiales bacterium]|nr:hypothetical protein [Thermomicrobiales bacterium]